MRSFIPTISLVSLISAFSSITQAQQIDTFSQIVSDCLSNEITRDNRIEACEFAVATDDLSASELSDLLVVLSDLRLEARDYGLALHGYQRAIATNPENVKAHDAKKELLGSVMEVFSDNPDALVEFVDRGLLYDANDSALFGLRAIAYRRLGDLASALSDFEMAMELHHYPHFFQLKRARLLWESDQAELASEDFEFLIRELAPNGPLVKRFESEIRQLDGYDRIVRQNALDFVPKLRIDTFVESWKLNRQENNFEAALVSIDALRQLLPNDLDVSLERAELLEVLGRTDDALQEYEAAIALSEATDQERLRNAMMVKVLLSRAELYIGRGSIDLALNHFRTVFTNAWPGKVQELQDVLTQEGFYTGELDDVYDSEVEIALRLCLEQFKCTD